MFTLHPRLEAGSYEICRIKSCQIRLKNNASYPWFLIIPEVDDSVEDLHQLPTPMYQDVVELIRTVSQFVSNHFEPSKLNVGCIGNQVRQMHIHIVGRSETDSAWPGTVWAANEKTAYSEAVVTEISNALRTYLDV